MSESSRWRSGFAEQKIDTLLVGGADSLLLVRLLLFVALVTVLLIVYTALNDGWQSIGWFNPGLVAAILVAYGVSRWGYILAGWWVLFIAVAAVLLLNGVFISGVRAVVLAGLPLLLTFSAFVLGRRQVLAFSGLIVLALIALTYADSSQWLPPMVYRSPLTLALVNSVLVAFAAGLGILATKNFRGQYQQAVTLARELHHHLSALLSSETRFSTLFRASPVPCLIVDDSGIIIDANDVWFDCFGLFRDSTVGQAALDIDLWGDDGQRDLLRDDLRRSTAPPEARLLSLRAKGRLLRQFKATFSRMDLKNQRCTLCALVDQTDRIAAELAQRELNAQLEQKVAERNLELSTAISDLRATQLELMNSAKFSTLGASVSAVSGELSSPIAKMVSEANSLVSGAKDFVTATTEGSPRLSQVDAFVAYSLDKAEGIQGAAEQAAALVARFKQASIDEASGQRKVFSVGAVAQRVVEASHHTFWGIRSEIPDSVDCEGFPKPLSQILTSLVIRATAQKFHGDERGRILILGSTDGEQICVSVAVVVEGTTPIQPSVRPPTTPVVERESVLDLSTCGRIASTVLGGELKVEEKSATECTYTLTFPIVAPGKL